MDPSSILALAALVKASQPVAVPVVKRATSLLGKLLGPGADALGARIGEFLTPPTPVQPTVLDAIARWRHGNMTLLLARTAEVLDKRGVEPRPIPIAVLFPLLEAASLVDDVDLTEMWAQLLASGVEADEHQHPMWVRILAQMSAVDARAFAAACATTDRDGVPFAPPGVRPMFAIGGQHPEDTRLNALDVVVLVSRHDESVPPEQRVFTALDPVPTALLSELGAQFRRAVMPRD
ncbi:MAG: DUF4393 domain-containing protein [Planctomycetes bacterium]|nr:DUF4393 domain-containing protein [Planctomycetota bacterium]